MQKKRKKPNYCWTKKEMDFVEKEILRVKKKLNIQEWFIEMTFRSGNNPTRGDTAVCAQIKVSPEYLRAYIWFYPSLLARYREAGKEFLADTVRHELSHIITEELYSIALDRFSSREEIEAAREKLTERISRLIKDV